MLNSTEYSGTSLNGHSVRAVSLLIAVSTQGPEIFANTYNYSRGGGRRKNLV